MKALTIRQPWAWAIVHGPKRLENRDWPGCSYRGPILIHASKNVGVVDEFDNAVDTVLHRLTGSGRAAFEAHIDTKPGRGDLRGELLYTPRSSLGLGGIVGRACIVDVVLPGGSSTGRVYPSAQAAHMKHALAEDPWYTGGFALVLADVEPVPFVACRGALGLWDVPSGVEAEVVR